jgi:cytolysin-activating lysine-acyltransferase
LQSWLDPNDHRFKQQKGRFVTLISAVQPHSVNDWARANKIDILSIIGPLSELSFPRSLTRSYVTSKCFDFLKGLDRAAALKSIVLPSFDRLLGKGVAQKALRGRLSFAQSDDRKPPYTIDRGHELSPQIHLPWTGRIQELVWLAHEVAHAVQIKLSGHALMPPLARETCSFLGELALIDYVQDENPDIAQLLQSVWREQSSVYLGDNLEFLKASLQNRNAAYNYDLNYPLARLASQFLHPRLTPSEVVALFQSGRGGMDFVPVVQSLSHFAQVAKEYAGSLSEHALAEVQLGQIDEFWLTCSAKLSVVQSNGLICRGDRMPNDHVKWRSLGVLALSALQRGEANIKPAELLERYSQSALPTPRSTEYPVKEFDGLSAIGLVIHHLARSEYHSGFALSYYLPTEILPALASNQLDSFVHDDGTPTGLVTWAWLSETVEISLTETGRALTEDEWHSGSRLFFNDWITQASSFRVIITELTERVFADQIATAFRRNADGTIRKICRFIGKKVAAQVTKSPDPSPRAMASSQ